MHGAVLMNHTFIFGSAFIATQLLMGHYREFVMNAGSLGY
jgi:hypothetical protein